MPSKPSALELLDAPAWMATTSTIYGTLCNTLGVCHQLSNGFELKNDMSGGNEGVKIKST